MRDDDRTPTPDAAAAHERRHHHVEPLPASHGIRPEDVDFRMAGDPDDDLGTARWGDGVREALTAELRRLG